MQNKWNLWTRRGVSFIQGCLFFIGWENIAIKISLFQAILTLSPAEAEPLKKTYVKLCDAYGILGNLRLNAGEVGFQFLQWRLFKVLLLREYSTSWPWSLDAYQLGRLARQRWSHHNHKTPPNPLSSGLQDHRCQNVQPERLPTRRGESCGDHQVAHQWGRIFLLVTSGTESHHWPDHGCPEDSQVKKGGQGAYCWLFADLGFLSNLTIGSSGTVCCTFPMWGQESVLLTGW